MEIEKKEESRKNVFKRVYEWTLKKYGKDDTSRRIIKFFFVHVVLSIALLLDSERCCTCSCTNSDF